MIFEYKYVADRNKNSKLKTIWEFNIQFQTKHFEQYKKYVIKYVMKSEFVLNTASVGFLIILSRIVNSTDILHVNIFRYFQFSTCI